MAHEITYEDDGRGIYVSFSGSITGEELIQHVRHIYESDTDHCLRWKLNDFLDVDTAEVSNEELREMAFIRKARIKHYPVFLNANVTTNPALRNCSMIVSSYSDDIEGFQSETFRSIESARRWITSMLAKQ